jgi:ABC-2 type transport system permease protein
VSTPTTAASPAASAAYELGALLTPGAQRRRAGALAASATFGWRAMLKIKHEPKQLADVIALPIVFTVLFTYLFGGALGGSPGSYLKVLLPGTMVMSITIVTVYGGARLAKDVTTGVSDRFRSLSIWRGALVLGGMLGDALRYLTGGAVVVILGVIIGYRPDGGAPGVIAAIALVVVFGLSLSWLWAAVAMVIPDPANLTSLGGTLLFPLAFASNIFVQPSTMPGWLQAFIKVNPVAHVTTAARDLMNNTSGAGGAVTWSLTAAAVITLIFAPLAIHLYNKQE